MGESAVAKSDKLVHQHISTGVYGSIDNFFIALLAILYLYVLYAKVLYTVYITLLILGPRNRFR